MGDADDPMARIRELHQAQHLLHEQAFAGPQRAMGQVLGALTSIRATAVNSADFFARSADELGAAGEFDRVLVSRIEGATWLPHALFCAPGAESGGLREYLRNLEIPLNSSPLEAHVVRRRTPMVVQDPGTDDRTHGPLMRIARTDGYVVAPVLVDGAAIALVHADTAHSGRVLTTADRDILRVFADGLGPIYERVVLSERLDEQRRRIGVVFDTTQALLDDIGTRPLTLDTRTPAGTQPEPLTGPTTSTPEIRLTARELDVMELMSTGMANAEIALRLSVSESTIKSHVKHVFRKLGARNRAGAIARFGKLQRVSERML